MTEVHVPWSACSATRKTTTLRSASISARDSSCSQLEKAQTQQRRPSAAPPAKKGPQFEETFFDNNENVVSQLGWWLCGCMASLVAGGSDGKESACNAGDTSLIPGSGRFPGEGNGNPLSILAWKVP